MQTQAHVLPHDLGRRDSLGQRQMADVDASAASVACAKAREALTIDASAKWHGSSRRRGGER